MELIKRITEQIGITQDQAQSGLGLLFRLAKDKLNDSDFKQISDQLPGLEQWVASAPGSTIGRSGLGSLIGMVDGFASIGLDSDKISELISIVIPFVQEEGGDGAKGLLSKVLVYAGPSQAK